VKAEEFQERLSEGGTVPMSRGDWEGLAPSYQVVERHNTQLAGDLLIVNVAGSLVAVEEPSREARVARVLGGPSEARVFVEKRLGEYERMWDGCGVKIDYFEGR
jgi:hypothetical protein